MRKRKVSRDVCTTEEGTRLAPVYAAAQVDQGEDEKLKRQETYNEIYYRTEEQETGAGCRVLDLEYIHISVIPLRVPVVSAHQSRALSRRHRMSAPPRWQIRVCARMNKNIRSAGRIWTSRDHAAFTECSGYLSTTKDRYSSFSTIKG